MAKPVNAADTPVRVRRTHDPFSQANSLQFARSDVVFDQAVIPVVNYEHFTTHAMPQPSVISDVDQLVSTIFIACCQGDGTTSQPMIVSGRWRLYQTAPSLRKGRKRAKKFMGETRVFQGVAEMWNEIISKATVLDATLNSAFRMETDGPAQKKISERPNTSLPDSCLVLRQSSAVSPPICDLAKTKKKFYWEDIVVPYEYKLRSGEEQRVDVSAFLAPRFNFSS
jgi:hypothetical protein